MHLPGAGYGGYLKLSELVQKGALSVKDVQLVFNEGVIFANGKLLQGFRVAEGVVLISGVHYTSWEWATQIRSQKRIEPSLDDPFVYISEPGKMTGWPEETIRKELGAASANTEVILSVAVPIERVWLKVSRFVAHYAITGALLSRDIRSLEIRKRK